MDVCTEMLVFFQDFEGLTEVFVSGRPLGYSRGRPRDIRPQNLLFGLLFRSSLKTAVLASIEGHNLAGFTGYNDYN